MPPTLKEEGCEHGTPLKTWCDACDDLVYSQGQVICPECFADQRTCGHKSAESSLITPPPLDGGVVVRGVGDPSRPDDLRAAGWSVAVHNDYRLDGEFHTFWLFTRDGRAVKGEGTSDREALDIVRAEVDKIPSEPP